MRYKANCQIDDYTVIYTEENEKTEIELSLNTEEDSQFKNLIFNEGETKVFYLTPKVYVCTYDGPERHFDEDYCISGVGKFPQIQLAITVHNGDIDVSVKPFSYSLDDIYWNISEGDMFDDYKLKDELKYSYWDEYLYQNKIEYYFMDNITVEEIED